ncbi:MAG TPA: amidohydrolase family protein [Methylomirabilota bacterium]|nr:amidohydrolase family protein [Methylomirabilota bacterium]
MKDAKFFSADSHVNEPPEAWERIPKNLRAHGPHFVKDPPGKKGLYMVFDGHEPDPVGMTFTAGIDKSGGNIRKVIETFTWEDWRGPWDPVARLKDMDLDGVKIEVLYPSMARNFYSLKGEETPLQKAGLRSYNDWMRDYCNTAPDRLIGLCLLSALDVDWSIEEIKRCAKLGFKGAVLPSGLPDGTSYGDPDYDRLWQLAQDMNFPIHFHVNILQGRDRMAARLKVITKLQQGRNALRRAILEPLNLLTDLVFGGVLDRFPRLPFVFAEYDLAWIQPFINKMDGSLVRARSESPDSPTIEALPSECIRRQVYATFQDDRAGVLGAEPLAMVDNYMWASDYPHGGSTWPNSKAINQAQFDGIASEIEQKLTWQNAAKFYGVA